VQSFPIYAKFVFQFVQSLVCTKCVGICVELAVSVVTVTVVILAHASCLKCLFRFLDFWIFGGKMNMPNC